jgi:hypothetical protein
MGFIFVPLTTAAMGALANEQVGNATGFYNVVRNIGGSVGIAAITTLLARGAQRHQALLVHHVSPYDPEAQYLARLGALLGHAFAGPTTRRPGGARRGLPGARAAGDAPVVHRRVPSSDRALPHLRQGGPAGPGQDRVRRAAGPAPDDRPGHVGGGDRRGRESAPPLVEGG